MIQQSPEINERAADVLQYLTGIGIVTLIVLIYRLDHRVAKIEQKLFDPSDGIVAQLSLTRRFRHWCRNKLWALQFRTRAIEQHAGITSIEEVDDFPERNGE